VVLWLIAGVSIAKSQRVAKATRSDTHKCTFFLAKTVFFQSSNIFIDSERDFFRKKSRKVYENMYFAVFETDYRLYYTLV